MYAYAFCMTQNTRGEERNSNKGKQLWQAIKMTTSDGYAVSCVEFEKSNYPEFRYSHSTFYNLPFLSNRVAQRDNHFTADKPKSFSRNQGGNNQKINGLSADFLREMLSIFSRFLILPTAPVQEHNFCTGTRLTL